MTYDEMLDKAKSTTGFNSIPLIGMPEEILKIGINNIHKYLSENGLDTPNDYYCSAMIAVFNNPQYISRIHPDFVDRDMAKLCYKTCFETLTKVLGESRLKVLSDEMINEVIFEDIAKARLIYKTYSLTTDTLLGALNNNPGLALCLVDIGREDIMDIAAKKGIWPKWKQDVSGNKPLSLEEAISRRMRSRPERMTERLYLNSYIKTYPIDLVVNSMRTKARKVVLLDLYPNSDLIRFLKDDKTSMGTILEREIGL